MMTNVEQRWRDRRGTYRPLGELFEPARHEVALMPGESEAKAFVNGHHYSGSFPSARLRVGLYERGAGLVGVAVFSHPVQVSIFDALPCPREESVELGRVVLLDRVRSNGESWFLARAFELARAAGFSGALMDSDPHPRVTADGTTVFAGHIGNIYQASNAVYIGRTPRKTVRLLPDGRTLSNRAIQKIRGRERGWRYASELLASYDRSVEPLTEAEDSHAWLWRILPRLTRTVRHPGNHRYLVGLDRATRRHLPTSLPYPKFELRSAS